MFRLSFMFIALLTAGCVSLDPHYDRPAAPVPATLPGAHGESTAVVGDWQKVVNDARLKKVVSIALNSNRDVQKALADIEAARAQYGETRASLFPTVDAELSHTRSKTVASGLSSASQADGAVSSFELDLFGKNQSLSRAARETWLASEFTEQNTRLTMIADLTTAWVTLATDNSNLALAQQTMDSAANSRNIVARQMAVGTASAGDLSSAESVYQQARASVASYRTLVAQDKNAINLLAGETVPESLLPGTLESLGDNSIALVPAGVSSSVLLRRPDIQEAEHNLKSANADIGAARANFFPSISLTASAGVGSDSLSSLFSHGMQVWSFAPSISLPLFTGGRTGWVHALVAIAAPHDGSTFPDVQPDAANALSTLFLGAARALGISAFKGVYDFRLDQFGIRRDPDEPLTTAALRMLAQNPLPAGDNAFDDLRCAGARALNARIATLPDAWYFSIPCCRTLPRLLTHDQKPDTAMTPLLWPFSTAMGRAGGAVPSDWLPNDGLVNTVSARYPGGAPHTDFAPGQTPQRGVWQVLPVENLDHLAAIGGVMNTGVVRTRMFYRRVMALLDAAAAAGANS